MKNYYLTIQYTGRDGMQREYKRTCFCMFEATELIRQYSKLKAWDITKVDITCG
jgi:hypothetical protein